MNTSQLRKLGVPDECLTDVIMAIQAAAAAGGFKGSEAKRLIRSILEKPEDHADQPHFGPFARALVKERNFVPPLRLNIAPGERKLTTLRMPRCGSRAGSPSPSGRPSCPTPTWDTACRSAAFWLARTP